MQPISRYYLHKCEHAVRKARAEYVAARAYALTLGRSLRMSPRTRSGFVVCLAQYETAIVNAWRKHWELTLTKRHLSRCVAAGIAEPVKRKKKGT